MTSYHTNESYTRRNESGRMATIIKQRWLNDRIQELTGLSDVNPQAAREQAERDWVEFTDCPF